jgi:hypothetical protein
MHRLTEALEKGIISLNDTLGVKINFGELAKFYQGGSTNIDCHWDGSCLSLRTPPYGTYLWRYVSFWKTSRRDSPASIDQGN